MNAPAIHATALLRRLTRPWRRLKHAYYEWRIREAQKDIKFFEAYDAPPERMLRAHRLQIQTWRIEQMLLSD